MAIVTSQPATVTVSVSEGSERDTASAGASEDGLHRIYRCRRCSQRKFRTSRDLATHILAKHSHVHLVSPGAPLGGLHTQPSPSLSASVDDTKSVTLTSPLITAADMCDIDCLLAAVSKSRGSSVKAHNTHSSRTIRRSQVSPLTRAHVNAPPQTHTISSSRTIAGARVTDAFTADTRATNVLAGQWRRSKRPTRKLARRAGKTECTGPSSHDVYIRRCRKGQIRVVPMHSQPSETLNFAQGLF